MTGGRLARDVRWPGVLARELAGAADVIEEGLNGRTTVWDDPFTDGRNGRAYLLPCLRSHAPVDILVLMLGTNDLKAIFRLGAAEVAAGAMALVDVALASGAGPDGGVPRILLVSPPRLGEATDRSELWGFGTSRATSGRLARLYRTAAELRAVAFLDASAIVTADPVDGVHLSADSHATLARAIAAAVRPLLPGGA